MKLVIVRHGETNANIINNKGAILYTGSLDNEYTKLTKKGILMAKKLNSLEIIRSINKIYASDLSRTIDTAMYARPDLKASLDSRLRERSLGDFQGLSENDLLENEKYKKYILDPNFNKFRRDFIQKAPNGENYTDVYNRVKSFFEELEYNENDVIGIFSHFNTIRCMYKYFFDLSNEEVMKLMIKNCECNIIEVTDGKYTLMN